MCNRYLLLLTQIPSQQKTSSVAGLTLIESIAAMVITTLILTAMAPPLLYSGGTRIQSQRFEQAQGIARQERDRIIAVLSRKQGIAQSRETGNIPPESSISSSPLWCTPPPTEIVSDRANLDSTNKALAMDVDGDGENDFFVQLMRDEGVRFGFGGGNDQLAVFQMGIRVYDIAARDQLGNLANPQSLPASELPLTASLNLTQGLGERSTRPLAVTYTEVSRSDLKLSLDAYREYLNQRPTNNSCS